jgi:ATP-dependent Clp protease protease subunit
MKLEKNKRYFQLVTTGNVAELTIYGDITSFPWFDGDVSANNLSRQLAELQNVSQINVYINSYGGEVAEGLAIYNALKRHPAKIVTYCDGFACSIASVIFMAGEERIMCNPSFLMIHDAWSFAAGNADELRKQADDLEKITTASVEAYMARCNLTEDELRAKMKAETWLTHTEAVEMGFATGEAEMDESDQPSQNAKKRAFELFLQAIAPKSAEDDEDAPENPDDESDDEDDSDDSKGIPEPKKEPDDEKDDAPDPAQRWSGFFNALFRE